jgi:hypothetical protein
MTRSWDSDTRGANRIGLLLKSHSVHNFSVQDKTDVGKKTKQLQTIWSCIMCSESNFESHAIGFFNVCNNNIQN